MLPSVIKQQSKFPEPTGDQGSRALRYFSSSVLILAAVSPCSNQVVEGILNVWGRLPKAVHFLLWKVTLIDVFDFACTDLALYVWWVCLVGGCGGGINLRTLLNDKILMNLQIQR